MKLTQTVVEIIGAKKDRNARAIRQALELALNFTAYWVEVCIRQNKDNGPLTTVKAVQILKKSLGLSEKEILEESSSEVRA